MRLTPVFLLVVAVVLGWSLPAHAHTSLVSTDPAEGARLDAAPTRIVLTFSEELQAPSEAIVTVDGERREWTVAVEDARVVLTPAGDPVDGAYEVDYRVVSADGHPISGTLAFSVGEPAEVPSDTGEAAPPGDSTWSTPLLVGTALAVLAVLGGAVALVRGRSRSGSGR